MPLTASEIKAAQGEFAVLSYQDIPVAPSGFRLVATSLDMNNQAVNDTGYFGAVFEKLNTNGDGTSEFFISHRGTNPTSTGDLANDWSILQGEALSQFGAVDQFVSWLEFSAQGPGVDVANVYSSGHSLGKVLSDYTLVKHGALLSQGLESMGSE